MILLAHPIFVDPQPEQRKETALAVKVAASGTSGKALSAAPHAVIPAGAGTPGKKRPGDKSGPLCMVEAASIESQLQAA